MEYFYKHHAVIYGVEDVAFVQIIHKKQKNKFIQDAENVHDDRYNYSLVDYINNNTKIKIRLRDAWNI